MAINIVGYTSPFKKTQETEKDSPLKWVNLALAAAPGLISAAGSLWGGRKRRREQRAAAQELEAARQKWMNIEYKNPYEDLRNPYAGLENPYEDLTVNTQAADYMRQQQQQQQANLMAGMQGAAGGSGVAGLAQAMANVGTQQAQRSAAMIAQQERQNQLLSAKGAASVDMARRQGQFKTDMLTAQGEHLRRAQENRRTESMYGLAIDRKIAADAARQKAREGFVAGLGQAAGGIAGHYGVGGEGHGDLSKDIGSFKDWMGGLQSKFNYWRDSRNPGGMNPNLMGISMDPFQTTQDSVSGIGLPNQGNILGGVGSSSDYPWMW